MGLMQSVVYTFPEGVVWPHNVLYWQKMTPEPQNYFLPQVFCLLKREYIIVTSLR